MAEETIDFLEEINQETNEDIINSLSEGLMVNNIISQIDNLFNDDVATSNEYYADFFTKRYQFIKSKYAETDPVIANKATESLNILLDTILSSIYKQFKFNITFQETIGFELKLEYTLSLYRFFVLDYKERFSDLVCNYIQLEKQSLLREYTKVAEDEDVKNNLSFITIRNYAGIEGAPVVYYLNDILKNMEFSYIEDMFNLIIKEDPDEMDCVIANSIFINQVGVDSIVYHSTDKHVAGILLGNLDLLRQIQLKISKRFFIK